MTIAQLPPGPPPPPDDDDDDRAPTDASRTARHDGHRHSTARRGPEHGHGIKPAPRVPLLTRLKLLPAVCAGCDIRVLARTPSEWTYFNVLGCVVLIVAMLSGGSALVAISYAMQVPAAHIWWIGLAWMLAMAFGVERLMLQIASTDSVRALAAALSYRLALVAVIGLMISEPLIVLFNHGELNNVLSQERAAALVAAENDARSVYNGRINADYKQITAVRHQETTLAGLVEHYTFLSQCEAGAPDCSHTHEVGKGVYYHHYARLAAHKEAQLKSTQPQDRADIHRLQQDIQTQQTDETAAIKGRTQAIDGRSGFLARLEALGTLEAKHPIVTWEAWLLRAFFWLWDLLPLTSLAIRSLTVKDSPYEALCRAERRRDGLQAKQLDTACDIEEDSITRQGGADKDWNRVRISDWLDDLISGAGDPYDSAESVRGEYGASRGEPVDAWDLSKFAKEMTAHEKRAVTVPRALRRAGTVAALMALGTVLASGVWSLISGAVVAGTWLAVVAFAAVAALAAVTRGFRTAPSWAARAMFGSLLASFLLPIAVIGLNIV